MMRNRYLALPALFMTVVVLAGCAADSSQDRRRGQTLVCHDGEKTLAVSNAKSIDHLQHGDAPGPCPDEND